MVTRNHVIPSVWTETILIEQVGMRCLQSEVERRLLALGDHQSRIAELTKQFVREGTLDPDMLKGILLNNRQSLPLCMGEVPGHICRHSHASSILASGPVVCTWSSLLDRTLNHLDCNRSAIAH